MTKETTSMDQPIPARLRDRLTGMLERHPFELCLAVSWVAAGALLIVAGLTELDPSPSFLVLPDWMAFVMGIPLLCGGVGTLRVMSCRYDDLSARWRDERLALLLAVSGFTGYMIAVLAYRPESVLPVAIAAGPTIGALARVRASRRVERRIRDARTVDRLRNGDGR